MRVDYLTASDLRWPWEGLPSYFVDGGSYKRSFTVDPYPCYVHDRPLVEDLVAKCVETHPLPGAAGATLSVLAHEFAGRTNGLACEAPMYKRPDGTDWEEAVTCHCGCGKDLKLQGQCHVIVLCGKRIPIMATMTRYLVGREYGHVAFNHRRRLLGYTPGEDHKLEAEYMRIRGVKDWEEAEGAPWHKLGSEVMANDFRILVMGIEPGFWPHEVPHPRAAPPAARAWWQTPLAPARAVSPKKDA